MHKQEIELRGLSGGARSNSVILVAVLALGLPLILAGCGRGGDLTPVRPAPSAASPSSQPAAPSTPSPSEPRPAQDAPRRPPAASDTPALPGVSADLGTPRLYVILSVDWEGRNLIETNLDAIAALRRERPEVMLTHFLCAAYFTKNGVAAGAAAGQIWGVVRPEDEVALHIHCWRSLVEAAGVAYREEPTFWGGEPGRWPDAAGDVGEDVQLSAYTLDEIQALVATSRSLLAGHGFEMSQSFRAGGWLGTPTVLEAIRREGFTIDSSSIATSWQNEIATFPLHERLTTLWSEVQPDASPFTIETPAGTIHEVPITGSMVDYVTTDEMIEHLEDALGRHRARQAAHRAGKPAEDTLVQLGFHQESAARFLPRLTATLAAVPLSADSSIVFSTVSQAVEHGRWPDW